MRPTVALGVLFILFLAIAFYFYPLMPDSMASHWNAAGEIDGFTGKFNLHLILVGMTLFLTLVFLVIPRIDPLKKNLQAFIKYYWGFAYIFLAFMIYLYLLVAAANLGIAFQMNFVMMPALAVIFFYLGWIMPKMKRNWFIGIRTPWTLSSDKVWTETHRMGGKVFMFIGLLFLLTLFLPAYTFIYVVALIVFGSFGVMAYSYFVFQKLEKK
jgi:uncharacterized membrane protein